MKSAGMKKTNTFRPRILIYVFVALCAFAMVLLASNNPFHIGNTYRDSSVFNYVARVILRGGMPYRDTFDHKGPLIYLIDAFGLIVNQQIGVWVIELVFCVITLLFTVKITYMLGGGCLSTCVAVAANVLTQAYFFDGGNLVEEYACTFITIALYLFCKYFRTKKINSIELIICGATFAAVCLLRINMISLWVVMCIGVLVDRVKEKRANELGRFIIWFIGGAALITVPILIWLFIRSALHPFIHDYFFFNFMYSSDRGNATISNVINVILYFSTSMPMILCYPIMIYFCIDSKNVFDRLCFLSIILSVLLICMSGYHFPHYGMILCPFVTYSVSRLLTSMDMNFSHTKQYATALFAAMALLFFNVELNMTKTIVSTILHPKPVIYENEVATIVKNNTKEGDLISVCGNENIIYLLSGRESASKYSYQLPIALIDPSIKEEYLDDLRKLHAQMIIVNNNDSYFYTDVCDIVNENYDLISIVGSTEVYLKR